MREIKTHSKAISYAIFLGTKALLFSCLVIIASCTSTAKNNQPNTLKFKNHSLVGKIWNVKQKKLINQNRFLTKLLSADYLLLGESHDNIRHHRYHSVVIKSIAEQKSSVGVDFEMIDDKQGALIKDTPPNATDDLIEMLNKEKTGWEYEKYYRPVFDSVFKAGFNIYSANINRESLISIISKGEEKIPAELKQQIDSNPLSKQQKASLKKQIIESHCGMANDGMIKGMTLCQQVRDAAISNNMLNIEKDTVILISGSGHIRKDRGVPKYIATQDPNAKIISVAWLEVIEELTEINDYSKFWDNNAFPFDYVWFTPASNRSYPCLEMKKHMDKMKKKHKSMNKETKKKITNAETLRQAI